MPTSRGWFVLVLGIGLWAAGQIFGTEPIEQIALALIVLVGMAVAIVRLGKHSLEVGRRISPERPSAGQNVTITLQVRNTGTGSAPLVLLEDALPRGLTGTPRFAVRGIEPRGQRELKMPLTAVSRGRYSVGPLDMSFLDPFGLARVRSRLADQSSFIVHPRIEPLALPRDQGERRSMVTSALRQPTVAQGEEFFTLREYTEGDDLRKIHWSSTAKRGRYMIRQEETPWHTRATLLLDDRARAYETRIEAPAFERAVEAAASLADLYHRSGYGFRIVGAHSPGVTPGRGGDHIARCLDLLATIQLDDNMGAPAEDEALTLRLHELERSSTAEASLVVVSGVLDAAEAVALTRCRRRFRQVTAIQFPPHRFGTLGTKARWGGEKHLIEVVHLLERAGVRVVALGPDDPLAAGWSSHRRGIDSHGMERPWGPKPELV